MNPHLLVEHLARAKSFLSHRDKQKLLMCRLDCIEVDREHHIVHLVLPELDAPDMTGAIRVARNADPKVRIIAVYNEVGLYCAYTRAPRKWIAVRNVRRGTR